MFREKFDPLFKDSPGLDLLPELTGLSAKETVSSFPFISYTFAPLPPKKVVKVQNIYFSGVENLGTL